MKASFSCCGADLLTSRWTWTGSSKSGGRKSTGDSSSNFPRRCEARHHSRPLKSYFPPKLKYISPSTFTVRKVTISPSERKCRGKDTPCPRLLNRPPSKAPRPQFPNLGRYPDPYYYVGSGLWGPNSSGRGQGTTSRVIPLSWAPRDSDNIFITFFYLSFTHKYRKKFSCITKVNRCLAQDRSLIWIKRICNKDDLRNLPMFPII